MLAATRNCTLNLWPVVGAVIYPLLSACNVSREVLPDTEYQLTLVHVISNRPCDNFTFSQHSRSLRKERPNFKFSRPRLIGRAKRLQLHFFQELLRSLEKKKISHAFQRLNLSDRSFRLGPPLMQVPPMRHIQKGNYYPAIIGRGNCHPASEIENLG